MQVVPSKALQDLSRSLWRFSVSDIPLVHFPRKYRKKRHHAWGTIKFSKQKNRSPRGQVLIRGFTGYGGALPERNVLPLVKASRVTTTWTVATTHWRIWHHLRLREWQCIPIPQRLVDVSLTCNRAVWHRENQQSCLRMQMRDIHETCFLSLSSLEKKNAQFAFE